MKKLYLIVILLLTASLLAPFGCVALDDPPAVSPVSADIPPSPPAMTPPVTTTGSPLNSFITSNFAGSGRCAVCHSSLDDRNGTNVSIDKDWRSTMMANAAKDPLWLAKVSSEISRHPELEAVIEDKCSSCHMPMAHTMAVKEESPVGIFGDGFLNAGSDLHDAASDGVSCTLCHQIQNVGLGEETSFSGHYPINTSLIKPGLIAYGPFPANAASVMSNSVGFTPQFGEQTLDSGHCATCHTLYTPVVNAAGEIIGSFPEQTPYLEWEHSDFGDGVAPDQSCQQCHMPAADTPVIISTMPRRLTAQSPFAQHYFVGGNTLMQDILATNNEALGLTASTSQQAITKERTLNQLENNTAVLSISQAAQMDDELVITVDVENKTGHKFPTGIPIRRAWVYIGVTDARGEVLFESGRPDDEGLIDAIDNRADENAFSPHYDIISDPSQVQIYETVMHDVTGEVTYTLLEALSYAKDNRLLPSGFDKTTAGADFAVYGLAANDNSFTGGGDRITYRIPAENSKGPYTVTVLLYYQTLTPRFATDLFTDQSASITAFNDYYQNAYRWPVTVASTSASIK